MAVDRLFAGVWATGFGTATGFIAGSVIQFSQIRHSLLFTIVSGLVSIGVLYYVLRATSDRWNTETLVFRLGLYFLTVFVASIVLTSLGALALGRTGILAFGLQVVLMAAAVALGIYVTFYGGVEWAIDEFTGIDVRRG